MKRGIALVIGNNEYEDEDLKQLDKAVNDAKAISEKFTKLNFDVLSGYDITAYDFDSLKEQFLLKLPNYPLGVFYFAGHGLEINGENILLYKDAKVHDRPADSIKRTAVSLQYLVDEMHKVCDTNILIIDACRTTFKESTRGDKGVSMAPIYIPKGTLIAFSTSPGDPAGEGPAHTPNSNYTTALIHHMDEKDLEIERFFKKVRTTLHTQTGGKQTSWEHTSLIGNLILNIGSIQSIDTVLPKYPYSSSALKDKEWVDLKTKHIVDALKSHNWSTQNAIVPLISTLKDLSPDQEFVIGRNILQAHMGDAFKCQEFINNTNEIANFTKPTGENHLLNGILFEIYFDSNGQFRGTNLKTDNLIWMTKLMESKKFDKSFEFINQILTPFSNLLLFIPSHNLQNIDIDIKGKYRNDKIIPLYQISNIEIGGRSLLTSDEAETHPRAIYGDQYKSEKFIEELSKLYGIPSPYIQTHFIEESKDALSYYLPDSKFKIIN